MASIEEAPPPNSPTPPTSVSAPNASPERNSSSSHPHHSHHHKSRRSHKPHVPKYPPKLTTTATTSPPTYELPRPKAVENKKRRKFKKGPGLLKVVLNQQEVKLLMALDSPTHCDDSGNTPLHRAALLGHPQATLHLIKKGASAKAQNIVSMLLGRGCKVNAKDVNGRTPLHYAVDKGFEGVAEQLLRQRANVNAAEEEFLRTPLHLAIIKGNKRMAELLLNNDANPNLEDINGNTPLHLSVLQEELPLCNLLLTARAKMWKKDSKGASAMHLAAAKGNLAIVEALIKEALPWMIRTKDLIDNKGLTPFHYAARGGHKRVIEALLADLPVCAEWKDDLGRTYQHVAIACRKPSCAQGSPLLQTLSHVGFASYVDNPTYSDLLFSVEDRVIQAHRVICQLYSFFFVLLGKLPLRMQEPIIIPDVKYEVFMEVLRYMYSGTIGTSAVAEELAIAANQFEMPYLHKSVSQDESSSSSSKGSEKKVNCFRRLRQSVNSSMNHDLEIVCADRDIVYAHKIVCTRSAQFMKLFLDGSVDTGSSSNSGAKKAGDGGGSDSSNSNETSNTTVRIEEIVVEQQRERSNTVEVEITKVKIPESKTIVVAFLEIVYCGFIMTELGLDEILKLYHFVDKYKLDKLMEGTLDVLEVVRFHLYDCLSVDNVVKIFGILSGEPNSITELVLKFLAKKNVNSELAKNASVKSSVIFSNIMKSIKKGKSGKKVKEDMKDKDKKITEFLKKKRKEKSI